MKHKTLGDVVAAGFDAEYDAPHQLDHEIEFSGPGWYSLARIDCRDVYQRGKFATYSRIRIWPQGSARPCLADTA